MGWFKKAKGLVGGSLESAALDVAGGVAAKLMGKWAEIGEGHTGKREKEIIMTRIVQDALTNEASGFRTFFLAYEGSAADQHPVIQILRGLVRPVLTIYLVAMFSWFGYQSLYVNIERIDVFNQLMRMTFYMNIVSLGFWFGDKLIQRTGLMDGFKTWAKHRPGNGNNKQGGTT